MTIFRFEPDITLSRSTLIALFGLMLVVGVVIGYCLPRFGSKETKPAPAASSQALAKRSPRPGIPLTIRQDGVPTSMERLISIYQANPNRFSVNTDRSSFIVEGRIVKVGESSPLDEVAGFYIPLSSAKNESEWLSQTAAGAVTGEQSVSLFVKGMSKADLAELDPGDLIKVNCSKVRVGGGSLLFDDCKQI